VISGFLNWLTAPNKLRLLYGRRIPSEPFSLSQAKKVLVVDPYALGDLVLTSPLVRELRALLPNAYIAWLVQRGNITLVELCPYVDEIIPHDGAPLSQNAPRWAWCLKVFWIAKTKLARHEFDVAIFPHANVDDMYSAALLYFSGAKWRFGYSEKCYKGKSLANADYDSLYTHVLELPEIKHEVERKLGFIGALGGEWHSDALEVWTDDEDEQFAKKILSLGLHQKPIVAFGIGTAIPKKRWPETRFAELAEWMVDNFDAIVLLLGDVRDRKRANVIVQSRPGRIINMTGSTTFRQCAALIRGCRLFVGNDSAPKHMAATAGLPVIEISMEPHFNHSGQTAESNLVARFGPWKTESRVVRPQVGLMPCAETKDTKPLYYCEADEPHCILGVSVDEVKAAVCSLLGEPSIDLPIVSAKPTAK
jgi:heptosyltransferase-2